MLSIVTVCRNSEGTIERCLGSVVESSRRYPGLIREHVIIDGLSEDSTPRILQSYLHQLLSYKVKIIREQDYGIYDAMNKALVVADSEYLIFLNSDDVILSDGLGEIYECLKSKGAQYAIYLAPYVISNQGRFFKKKLSSLMLLSPTLDLALGGKPFHPGFVTKKWLYKTVSFDASLSVAADFGWMYRCLTGSLENKKKICFMNKAIIAFASGGVSDKRRLSRGVKELSMQYRQIYGLTGILVLTLRYLRGIGSSVAGSIISRIRWSPNNLSRSV